MNKTCTSCGRTLCTSLFNKDKAKADGFSSWCKECKKHRRKAYDDAHKSESSARLKEWYSKNKDRVKNTVTQWRINNPDKLNLQRKKYRKSAADRGKRKIDGKRWSSEMMDSYIRNLMGKSMSISGTCIPDDLVEAKRLQLSIVRFLRKEDHEQH